MKGRDFIEVVKNALVAVGPISAEAISLNHEGMISEALELVKIHRNIVIEMLEQPTGHPQKELEIEKFLKDWEKVYKK